MEIGFWRLLQKDGPGALPLKQRVPEVALFRGATLEACYCSNPRGLLQRREATETTREALLERLLAQAARRADNADLGSYTPVAILRRCAPAGEESSDRKPNAPPVTSVLSASELLDLLERPGGVRFGPKEEWSLQSIVPPAEDMRIVVVYSCDALGTERLDIVGRPYQDIYPLGDASMGSSTLETKHKTLDGSILTDSQTAAVQAKTIAIVRYVHRFQQRQVEGLMAEFVADVSGRLVLHGFWNVALHGKEARTIYPDGLRSDDKQWIAQASALSPERPFHATSSTMSTTAGTASPPYGMSASIDAAGMSRPTSASNSVGGFGQSSRPVTPLPASVGAARSLQDMGHDSIQIPDDDGGGDDIDETIERLQAQAQPRQKAEGGLGAQRTNRQQRPGRPGAACKPSKNRPGRPLSTPMPAPSAPIPPSHPSTGRPGRGSRPSSARPKRPASAGSVRAEHAPPATASGTAYASKTWPLGGFGSEEGGPPIEGSKAHTPRKKIVHSQQLLSRFISEKDARTRLISVLVRQLERYRDLLPVWVEQRNAIRCVIARLEKRLSQRIDVIDDLMTEREQAEKYYSQKYDALVRGLAAEKERALAELQDQQAEMADALVKEAENKQTLENAEKKNEALKSSLDVTVTQLSTVRTEMLQCQAKMGKEANGTFTQVPELNHALHRLEALMQEKDHIYNETQETKKGILQVQQELNKQRAHSMQLEDFLRKVTAPSNSGYVTDIPTRREASVLVNIAAKLRAVAERSAAEAAATAASAAGSAAFSEASAAGSAAALLAAPPGPQTRSQSPPRASPSWAATTAPGGAFRGRRCCACDHGPEPGEME